MSDFRELLKQDTDSIKRPPPIPVGSYEGIVKGYKFDKSREKETDYVEYRVGLTSARNDVDQSELVDSDGKPIEINGKERSMTYYITPDALWRLTEMIKSCKIETKGIPLEETIPAVVGKSVLVTVTHSRPKGAKLTDPPYANISEMAGLPD